MRTVCQGIADRGLHLSIASSCSGVNDIFLICAGGQQSGYTHQRRVAMSDSWTLLVAGCSMMMRARTSRLTGGAGCLSPARMQATTAVLICILLQANVDITTAHHLTSSTAQRLVAGMEVRPQCGTRMGLPPGSAQWTPSQLAESLTFFVSRIIICTQPTSCCASCTS